MNNVKRNWKKRFIVVILMYCWFIIWVILTEKDLASVIGWISFLIMCCHFTYVWLEWRYKVIEKLREMGIEFEDDT